MSMEIVIAPFINVFGLQYKAYSLKKKYNFWGTKYSYLYKELDVSNIHKRGRSFDKFQDLQDSLIHEYGTRVRIVEWEAIR